MLNAKYNTAKQKKLSNFRFTRLIPLFGCHKWVVLNFAPAPYAESSLAHAF